MIKYYIGSGVTVEITDESIKLAAPRIVSGQVIEQVISLDWNAVAQLVEFVMEQKNV